MTKARGLADLGNVYSDGALSNRNLIINGAMQVAQRGTSITGVTTQGYFVCDRFRFGAGTQGTHTLTQEADGPAGFANSYKIAVTTADAAPAAADNLTFDHRFEGQNLQMLKKGTVSAESVTISFWVKSNKIGTYNLELEDSTNGRHIVAAYTIDASAIWQYKTVTFAGDTSGALIADNALRARLLWWLGSGTTYASGTRSTSWATLVNGNRAVGNVNLADTIGNTWQITGVQLEVGDTATPFEHRSFGQELALCQRYYTQVKANSAFSRFAVGYNYSGVRNNSVLHMPVILRATPTLTTTGTFGIYHGAELVANVSAVSIESGSNTAVSVNAVTTGVTTGSVGILIANNDVSTFLAFDAEL
jgi:hypothetical protein